MGGRVWMGGRVKVCICACVCKCVVCKCAVLRVCAGGRGVGLGLQRIKENVSSLFKCSPPNRSLILLTLNPKP